MSESLIDARGVVWYIQMRRPLLGRVRLPDDVRMISNETIAGAKP